MNEPTSSAIVLASASPRRAALLRLLGLRFEQIESPEKEQEYSDSDPRELVMKAAFAKSDAVRRLVARDRPENSTAYIVGADTIVYLDGRVFGKPRDDEDASMMLGSLSGRSHAVYTGLSIVGPDGRELTDSSRTSVQMVPLTEDEIAWYVATGEPLDKAGAYGIQGLAARFIERIEGCYYNVVGLPLSLLWARLREAGYDLHTPAIAP